MDIIFNLVMVGVIVGLLEIYRAHKNHVAFKTEATNDLTVLKDRVRYLENQAVNHFFASRTNPNSTPPPTA